MSAQNSLVDNGSRVVLVRLTAGGSGNHLKLKFPHNHVRLSTNDAYDNFIKSIMTLIVAEGKISPSEVTPQPVTYGNFLVKFWERNDSSSGRQIGEISSWRGSTYAN